MTEFQQKVISDLKRTRVIVERDIAESLADIRERFIFQGGSEFALKIADEMIELRRNNEELTAAVQAALLDQARDMELLVQAAGYEKVRRMSAQQFTTLFRKNIETGKLFDDLVDELP